MRRPRLLGIRGDAEGGTRGPGLFLSGPAAPRVLRARGIALAGAVVVACGCIAGSAAQAAGSDRVAGVLHAEHADRLQSPGGDFMRFTLTTASGATVL